MNRTLVWMMLFAFCGAVHAVPYDVLDVDQIDSVVPGALDLTFLAEEDATRDRLGLPPRFAVSQGVSITPAQDGTWEDLGGGWRLWRLRIVGAEGTTSLNLGFTRFHLPEGGRLLLYSADGTQVARPFTAADNEAHGQLWTPAVLTGDLIVELTVPAREAPAVDLKLG